MPSVESEILREGTPTPEELKEGLEVISRNTRALGKVNSSRNLLDMNRVLMGKIRLDIQMVDLTQVVEMAIKSVGPSVEAKGD